LKPIFLLKEFFQLCRAKKKTGKRKKRKSKSGGSNGKGQEKMQAKRQERKITSLLNVSSPPFSASTKINHTIGRSKMPTAFVLINTETGPVGDVLKDLKKVEGVDEAFIVYGVYDIIAKVSTKSMNQFREIVTWHIRKIDKVMQILTMMII